MTTQTQSSILEFYQRRKPDFSWQDIADILNTNKGTAWEIAHGKRAPTQDQELRWMFWLAFGPNADHRTIPAIPCPTCGQLHQVDDCHGVSGEPVIVPAGARVVQPGTPPANAADALALAEEMIGYVPDYFREKWGMDAELERLRRIVQPKPASKPASKPKRKRKQKDVIRLSRAGLSDGEIDAILWASALRPKEMFEFAGEILDAVKVTE